MLSKDESINYFLFGCIPTRIFLIYLSYIILYKYHEFRIVLGILLGIMGLGFLYLYFFNKRLQAGEAGGKTYWNSFRIIHGFLYVLGAYMAFTNNKNIYKILILDLLIGISIFYHHRKDSIK
jgi:hypothetical protein